jgi:hypothetical protein
VVVALATSCGGDDGTSERSDAPVERSTTSPGGQRESSTSTAEPLTLEEVEALLVPIDELPSGFAEAPPDEDADPASDTALCGQPDVDTVVPPVVQATVSYLQGTVGPYLAETVAAYASEAEARKAFDTLVEMADGCDSFEDTDDEGATTTYTVMALSFVDLADDQLALRLNAEADAFTGTFDLIFVRVDDKVALIAGGSVMSFLGPGQLAAGDLERFATTAVERLR